MKAENGNALFLILIAVALLAALSYAITHSSRSSGGIAREQAVIDQAVMDGYIAAIERGRQRLKILRHCATIDYTPPADQTAGDKACHMFHPDGAGVGYLNLDGACDLSDQLLDLALGAACDNLIFAGTSGGNRIYTTAANQGITHWSDDLTLANVTSAWDGLANTNAILALGDTGYPAAEICRALGPKWYLPAPDELMMLYTNRNAGSLSGSFMTTGTLKYWSSAEYDQGRARIVDFGNGTFGIGDPNSKGYSRNVRCVRRD